MDTSEFTELLRRHAGLIHRIASAYCRSAADREDVVQEVVAQLWRARTRYDGRHRHSTWIQRIALNVAISFHRRERRHKEGRQELEDHPPLAGEPVEESAEVELLLDCIHGLGALERAVVLLHLEGNDHATIAEVLGISVSNVGTKLQRIKEKLRTTLEARVRGREGNRHGTG